MNGLLAIAETFLDRMTNPQYGNEINDQYALRFNQLLAGDREFADSFARLDLDPEDVGSVPMCAWPWYLQWRMERAAPPSESFLNALFDSTDDPAVRMIVMQSALSRDSERSPGRPANAEADEEAPPDEASADETVPLGTAMVSVPEPTRPTAIQNRWLRTRVARMTSGSDVERGRMDISEIASYLLQTGDPASLEDLRRLLGDPRTRESLVVTVAEHLADAGLDPQTEADLRGELGLPPQQEPPPQPMMR
jgi:hypothetical protein